MVFNPEWPQQIEELACTLWGAPNPKKSTSTELRFGRKGCSTKVDLINCTWYDFDTGEGGGFLDLYRRVHGRNPDRVSCKRRMVLVDKAEDPAGANVTVPSEAVAKLLAELICPNKTRVQWYLRERGIEVSALDDVSYCRALWHTPTSTTWPGMVAKVCDVSGHVVALHRTWLSYSYTDRPPTKAPIEPNRMLLGEMKGCAIHLAPAAPTLVVGEGLETTASAMRLMGLPGWSAIDAGNLRYVLLPDVVRKVIILADNDPAGISGSIKAAQRFQQEGRQVHVLRTTQGNDFNDLLRVAS
jgi:hypothetical protein